MRALAASLILLAACSDDTGGGSGVTTEIVEVANVSTSPRAKLDLLLQVDDSASLEQQTDLAAAIGTLLAMVDGVDLHVGVISPDLGASSTTMNNSPTEGITTCTGRGRDGELQRGTSTVRDAYLRRGADGTTNYDGTLAAEVGAMINLGARGCAFEQPLAAIRRALAGNPGFRRDDAALAVLIFAEEDDCSILDSDLALRPDDPELGVRSSFRCTRFGITCDQAVDEVGVKTGCRSNEQSDWIEPLSFTSEVLLAEDAYVGAIVGPASPIEVVLRPPPMQTIGDLALAHGCTYPRGGTAENPTGTVVSNPAVRIAELVDGFASNGVRTELCAADLAPQLRAIGTGIKRLLGTMCLSDANLADARGAEGLQPSCEVILSAADGTRTNLPTCASGAVPCFTIAPDAAACAETVDHLRLTVTGASPGGRIIASCEALVDD